MKNVYLLLFFCFSVFSNGFSQISSTALGGDWSNPATWVGGVVPGNTDDVTIVDNAVVNIDTDATIANLTVGGGNSGILQYEEVNARTLTVTGNVTISTGAIFRSATAGSQTAHVLSVAGNITNDGTLNFSTNGNTAGTEIIFTGAANTSFSGVGPVTDISLITVDKGNSAASVVDLSTTNFTFKGSSSTSGDLQSFLTLTNGTFKISGTFVMDNGVFTGTGAYNIPATAGFWLNNPNFTVNPRGGTADVDGTLQVDAGVMNIGNAANNRLGYVAGTVIIINGGVVNVASRFSATTTFGVSYTQTGGVFNVNTIGNTSGTRASFDIRDEDNSSFTMSGGTIVLQNAGISGTGPRDYFNDATNVNITGGTLQVGNALTGSAQTFLLSGDIPSLTISNTVAAQTALLFGDVNVFGNTTINTGTTLSLADDLLAGHTFTQRGTTFTNAGTLNASTVGSVLAFAGTAAQTYGGDGAIISPINSLVMNNAAGLTITNAIASDITSNQISMLAGDITTGVSTLALGTSIASPGTFNYVSGTIVGKFKRWLDAVTGSTSFPVGVAGSTRTAAVDFTAAPATGGTLTAEFIPVYGGTNGLPLVEPGYPAIDNVAPEGYWSLVAGDGLAGGAYTGTFTATNFSSVIDFTQLVLIKRVDNASPWTLDGTHVPTTGSNTTPILSRTGMVGFGEYAVGGSTTSLPITIEYFKGSRQAYGNLLDWKITCTNSPTALMVLERSNDGRKFSPVYTNTATSLRCLQPFNYLDASPAAGMNYYRIRLTDADGKMTYSNIIALLNKDKGFALTGLMPNPVKDKAVLAVASAKASRMEVVITDVNGKKVSKTSVNLIAGSNQVNFELGHLPAGSYQLTGYDNEGEVNTLRFIKR